MDKTLLPQNASPLELALSATRSKNVDLPSDINTLIDPQKCPVQFLPFLAWARSVDYWDHEWPVQVKRDMIANSRRIHKIKGTVPALRMVLAIFGYTAAFKYWYQQQPNGERGSFEMTVNLHSTGITERREQEILRLIDETKAISRHISRLNYAVASSGAVYVGAAIYSGEVITVYPYTVEDLTSSCEVFVGGGVHEIETITIYPAEVKQ